MHVLYIPGSDLSPHVEYSPGNTVLKIEGRIIPENVEEVFSPINTWIDGFLKESDSLTVLFRLYYYNTSSFKRLYNLGKKLNSYYEQGKNISARWEYLEEDEDSVHDAQELFEHTSFPYTLVEVTE